MPVPAKGKGGKPKGKVVSPSAAEAPAEQPEAKEEEKDSASPEAELKHCNVAHMYVLSGKIITQHLCMFHIRSKVLLL